MKYVQDFFHNYLLISSILGWLIAQTIKIFTGWASNLKFDIGLFFSNGGMPSSHSATVMALCTSCAIQEGIQSPAFVVSVILAAIVMNDASGVRYEAGEQAKIINRITKELFSGRGEEINTGLKELVGHTRFQVFMGALLGVAIAVVYGFIIGAIHI